MCTEETTNTTRRSGVFIADGSNQEHRALKVSCVPCQQSTQRLRDRVLNGNKVRISLFFVIVFASMFTCAVAQDSTAPYKFLFRKEKSIDLWLGYNLQGNSSDETGETTMKYLEIGIGKGRYIYHMHGITGAGVYVSEEILLNKNKNIYGTKIGCFAHWMFDAGFSIVYYTDFEKGNLKLRPELGVGMGRVRGVVGYNIPTVNNKAMPELRKQNMQVTLQAGFGLKRKAVKQNKN